MDMPELIAPAGTSTVERLRVLADKWLKTLEESDPIKCNYQVENRVYNLSDWRLKMVQSLAELHRLIHFMTIPVAVEKTNSESVMRGIRTVERMRLFCVSDGTFRHSDRTLCSSKTMICPGCGYGPDGKCHTDEVQVDHSTRPDDGADEPITQDRRVDGGKRADNAKGNAAYPPP